MIHLYPLLFAIGVNTAPTTEPRYAGAVEGTWDGAFRPAIVHMYMRIDRERGFSTFGRTYSLEELSDFRREKRAVGFELRRNAGTFRFDGAAVDLRATGTFEFIPSAAYRKAAEKLGFRKLDRHHQLSFALHDVTLDELRYLRRVLGTRITSTDLVQLFDRGVTPEYVRDLAGVGFARLKPEQLIRIRDIGVDADYVRGLRAAGLPLSRLEDFVKARNAGLSAEYIKSLSEVGLLNLTLAEYITLHEADVTAEYAASIYELGYSACDITDLVRMRNQGITASYIRKANKQAGEQLNMGELVRYRTRGDY